MVRLVARTRNRTTIELVQIWPSYYADCEPIDAQFSFLVVADVASLTWGTWEVRYRTRIIDRQVFISDLSLDFAGSSGEWPRDQVSAAMLAALPLDDLRMRVLDWIRLDGRPFSRDPDSPMSDPAMHHEWTARRAELIAYLDSPSPRSGRVGRPHARGIEHHRMIAERAIACGERAPRAWLQALALELGEIGAPGDVVPQPLKDDVRACRERYGFLAPAAGRGSRVPPRPGPALLAEWKRSEPAKYRRWTELRMKGDDA